MDRLVRDVRCGLRQLRARPRVTAVAVLLLALGIGGSTAAFSLVQGLLLRPLPYPDSETLVSVGRGSRERPGDPLLSDMELRRLWDEARSFERLGAVAPGVVLSGDEADPTLFYSAAVTPSLFPLLGVAPPIGRAFTEADTVAGAQPVVLLSHRAWSSRFGSDPDVVGASIAVNREPHRVVGVLPDGFAFPYPETALWTPLVVPLFAAPADGALLVRGAYAGIGRLRPGVAPEQAAAEVRAILDRPGPDRPLLSDPVLQTRVVRLREEQGRPLRPALLALASATGLLLLMACANVAGLLLAHGVARRRELAIRRSFGAGRSHVVRQLLVENTVLSLAGGTLGLVVAAAILRAAPGLAPREVPGLAEVALDGVAFTFAAGLSLVAGLLCGAAPALLWSRDDLTRTLDETGSSAPGGFGRLQANRAQAALTVAQVALAIVVLANAGVLLRSFVALVSTDLGFDPAGVVTARVQSPAAYRVFNRVGGRIDPDELEAMRTMTRRATQELVTRMERIRALPGVRAAALASAMPLSPAGTVRSIEITGRPEGPDEPRRLQAGVRGVGAGYASALRLRLLAGRFFTDSDVAGAPKVAVVSETFARAAFDGRAALDQRIRQRASPLSALAGRAEARSNETWEIVGVVADIAAPPGSAAFTRPAAGVVYLPFLQRPTDGLLSFEEPLVVARTAGDPAAVLPFLHEALSDVHPGARVQTVAIETMLALRAAEPRFYAFCAGLFGAAALLLAAFGLYGVLSYVASQRRREIGVRMALGATRGDILRLIVGQGAVLAAAGAIVGLLLAGASTNVVEALLFGVAPVDPLTFGAVTALLVVVALVACGLPARAAARTDPMDALREG